MSFRGRALVTLATALTLGASLPATGQTLPHEPIVLGGGRVTIGGEVSATFSCADSDEAETERCSGDRGFFNYTDYEHSALRMLRVGVTAAVKAGNRLSLLGELRSENAGPPQAYALYARIRPWTSRAFDVQVGRVPPTFGAFARRTYPADNVVIGYPLAYQYLTSLRPDALPADADELLRMRGRGWLSNFSVGNTTPDRGLALVSAFRWDTGVQVHAANDFIDGAAAVTTGTLGNPLVGDDNAGKQVAGRVALRPTTGLIVGLSAARGPFLTRGASEHAGAAQGASRFTQTGWGADLEYSRDYYLVRFETIVSDWQLPIVKAPALDLPLRARLHDGGRPLQDPPRPLCGGTPGSSGLQHDHRLHPPRAVGRARDACRGWRGILGAAQSAAEAHVSAQHPGGRARDERPHHHGADDLLAVMTGDHGATTPTKSLNGIRCLSAVFAKTMSYFFVVFVSSW